VKRSSSIRLAIISVLLGLSAVAGIPAVTVGATTDPTVYEKHHPDPVGIPQSTSPAFAPLTVPAGRWIAWARLVVFTDGNTRRVRCTFTASNGGSGRPMATASQTAYVTTESYDNDIINLSASLKSLQHSVTFSLRCVDESATPPTAQPKAYQIRIMAMRLTSITQAEITDTTSASQRTTAPAILIHGYRNLDIAIPHSNVAHTVASLPLEAGLWSIRASFSVVSVGGTGGGANNGSCRIGLATNGSVRVLPTGDRVFLNNGNPGHDEDRQNYYLDTSGKLSDPGALRMQCWQTQGSGDLVVRRLRITALKLGTLKIASATTGDPSLSYGRGGLPYSRYARRQESFTISTELGEVIGRLKLPAGRWLLYAKLNYNSETVICELDTEIRGDEGVDTIGEQITLTFVASLTEPGEVTLTCGKFVESGPIEYSYVHITAIRVKAPLT
jgi:hypothetical protein